MDQSYKVIIVDDSVSVREELRDLFEGLGHEIVGECENGMEAIELVRQLKPDLVSLDIIMPEMDGIECYRTLQLLSSPPRCLIISALASEPRVIAAYEGDIDPRIYLPKPVHSEELANKIHEIMRAPRLPSVPSEDNRLIDPGHDQGNVE